MATPDQNPALSTSSGYADLVHRMRVGTDADTYDPVHRTALLNEGADAIERLTTPKANGGPVNARPRQRPLSREDAVGMAIRIAGVEADNLIHVAQRILAYTNDAETREARTETWVPRDLESDLTPTERIRGIVGQAIGAASTAWTGEPQGVFEDAYASSIVDNVMGHVQPYLDSPTIGGRYVEIGGQRMTQEQFDAARFPLLNTPTEAQPPAHGLAIGDRLDLERAKATPVGTVMTDKDGDMVTHDPRAGEPERPLLWRSFGRLLGHNYGPYTIVSLPEQQDAPDPEPSTDPVPAPLPTDDEGFLSVGTTVEVTDEDGKTMPGVIDRVDANVYHVATQTPGGSTYYTPSQVRFVSTAEAEPERTEPKLGDQVRVIDHPRGTDDIVSHDECAGKTGTLSQSMITRGAYKANGHVGPLSDFERVGD